MSTPILKSLKADPNSKVDFSQHEHRLEGGALEIWEAFANEHPYWWAMTDLGTVERYCQLAHIERELRTEWAKASEVADKRSVWMMVKQVSLEMKAAEYSLGLTPQSRAALKLKDPPDQGAREAVKKGGKVIDPSDL